MRVLAVTAWLATTAALVIGFLGGLHPALDSFAHFRAHLAVLVAAFSLPLLSSPRWRRAGAASLLVVAVSAWTVWPGRGALPLPAASGSPSSPAGYRLLQLNLHFRHPEPGRVLSLIARERPDVVLLEEVSAAWAQRFEATAANYPHRVVCDAPDAIGGVAILSRHPFRDPAPPCLIDGRFAVAAVDFDGDTIEVAAVHLHWPWPARQWRDIARLAPALGRLGEATILAGDFNATPWSAAFAAFVAAGRFEPPPRLGATWLHHRLPAAPRPFLGLPLDHVLVGPGLRLEAATRLDDAGSDHAPVLAIFSPAQRRR